MFDGEKKLHYKIIDNIRRIITSFNKALQQGRALWKLNFSTLMVFCTSSANIFYQPPPRKVEKEQETLEQQPERVSPGVYR